MAKFIMVPPPASLDGPHRLRFEYFRDHPDELVELSPTMVRCKICSRNISAKDSSKIRVHLESKKHQKHLKAAKMNTDVAIAVAIEKYNFIRLVKPGVLFCDICKRRFNKSKKTQIKQHMQTKWHLECVKIVEAAKVASEVDGQQFNRELAEVLAAAKIPLRKIKIGKFRDFLQKYTGRKVYEETVLRKRFWNKGLKVADDDQDEASEDEPELEQEPDENQENEDVTDAQEHDYAKNGLTDQVIKDVEQQMDVSTEDNVQDLEE